VDRWHGGRATRIRAQLARTVATGTAVCWRCGGVIDPREPWDVGHITGRANGGNDNPANLAPEHAVCNRRAGQVEGQARRRTRTTTARRIRDW